MSNRLVIAAEAYKAMRSTFAQTSREAAGFLLIRIGRTASGMRVLAADWSALTPKSLERQGRDHLRVSGAAVSAAISVAIDANAGLAFVHSHPYSGHPVSLSSVDLETSAVWARTLVPLLNHPFASVVWSAAGIRGRVLYGEGKNDELDVIEIQGGGSVLGFDGTAPSEEVDDRQRRALGDVVNDRIRRAHIALVGLGGTGSPAAEMLAQMGVLRLTLVDPDVVDTPSNLRRLLGAVPGDLKTRTAKVDVVARHLRSLWPRTEVAVIRDDVRIEHVARQVLDADVIVASTDTHSSRATLNQLAMQYWIPLVDVGVRIGTTSKGRVSGMPIEVRVVLRDNGCLWCRDVLSSERLLVENLPPADREERLREGYVLNIGQPVASIASLNHLAASAACMQLLRLWSAEPLPTAGVILDLWEMYLQAARSEINPECICRDWRGAGDSVSVAFLPVRS